MKVSIRCPKCGFYMVQEYIWQEGMPVYRLRCANRICNYSIYNYNNISTSNNKIIYYKPSSSTTPSNNKTSTTQFKIIRRYI